MNDRRRVRVIIALPWVFADTIVTKRKFCNQPRLAQEMFGVNGTEWSVVNNVDIAFF
jgi:hypothetical protein